MQILKELEKWGRARTMSILARRFSTSEADPRAVADLIARQSTSTILLIGLYQKLGQFLCATPMIRALAVAWPDATFHFIGNSTNASAARANPYLEKIWVWKKSALWEWPSQARALRSFHYDLAILLTTERPSATGVLLAHSSGAKKVAAYRPAAEGAWASDVASLCHIRIPPTEKKSEVAKFLGYADAFGVPAQSDELDFSTSAEDRQAAAAYCAALTATPGQPLVGLFIGGKVERNDRLWPVSSFAALADALKKRGCHVVVIAPPPPKKFVANHFEPEEFLRLNEFRRTANSSYPVFQEWSLGRVAAFLEKLNLLVCPDGGILHVAAAVRAPTLGLFFSTDPEVWTHGTSQTVLDGRGRAPGAMSVETVAHEVLRRLGSKVVA